MSNSAKHKLTVFLFQHKLEGSRKQGQVQKKTLTNSTHKSWPSYFAKGKKRHFTVTWWVSWQNYKIGPNHYDGSLYNICEYSQPYSKLATCRLTDNYLTRLIKMACWAIRKKNSYPQFSISSTLLSLMVMQTMFCLQVNPSVLFVIVFRFRNWGLNLLK